MKRFILLVTVCFVAISMFALEVNNLKTQAYTNPIGIDITTPSFSWMLSSTERGVVQVSYDIKVSTERDFSDVVWESGTIESANQLMCRQQAFRQRHVHAIIGRLPLRITRAMLPPARRGLTLRPGSRPLQHGIVLN